MTGPSRAEPVAEAEFETAFGMLADDPGPVLAAVSGGPDSTALLHALATWARPAGRPTIHVATVDHGLRPAARAEAEAVATAAKGLGLPHATLTWNGDKRSAKRASQAAARDARYGLLDAHAGTLGAARLVTAHTLDDQAETILIRLAAGSGPSGLAGMRRQARRGDLLHLRPFLHIPKARLIATCRARGWAFAEDPSNADPRYARTRWRRLMPELAAEGLDAARLGRLAVRMARAEAALERATDAAEARCRPLGSAAQGQLDMAALNSEPAEIALRVFTRALGGDGAARDPLPSLRLERVEACLDALLVAAAGGRPLRRTLAGKAVRLDGAGRVTISPEPARARGRDRAPEA